MSDEHDEMPAALATRPPGYAEWLAELKSRVQAAQQRAALAVNRELLTLYWQLGRDILERQAQEGWGAGVIDQVSADLRAAFPEVKGFSRSNLKYMRAFAEAWPDLAIGQPPVGQLPWAPRARIASWRSTRYATRTSRWASRSTSLSRRCPRIWRRACRAWSRSSGSWGRWRDEPDPKTRAEEDRREATWKPPEAIRVLAFAHNRRRPYYWASRST